MSIVSASVSPDASVTTYNINTSLPKNDTIAQAINIGNLDQESSIISVSDQGQPGTGAVSTTFTALNGTTDLSQTFGNIIDEASTQFQLFDSQGNIIADSQGTDAQQAAYAEWVNGSLTLTDGSYTAVATPPEGGPGLTIQSQEQQGTSLEVNSSLTGGDSTEFYNFSFSGANMKLDFDAGTANSSTRVQVFNSAGAIVADSQGDAFQQANYDALTSGTGLTTSSGNYTVGVSYAKNITTTPTIPYSLQLYSGNSYAVVYNNKVASNPTDNSAAGSVTATSDAKLYSDNQFNKINATAISAINIGWLKENTSALDVLSQLTSADTADYYSLTLQQGNNLKFGFLTQNTTDPNDLRVQILNSTGTQVLADSEGTPAQQAAYQQLVSKTGLAANPGTFVVKISYAAGAVKQTTPYEFGIYSGTSYSAQYKTIASAQTIGNALASGTYSGTAAASAIASYLTAVSHGDDTSANLTAALQASI